MIAHVRIARFSRIATKRIDNLSFQSNPRILKRKAGTLASEAHLLRLGNLNLKNRHGIGVTKCYSTSSVAALDEVRGDEFEAFEEKNESRFGRKLRGVLNENNDSESLAAYWSRATSALKESMRELRVLMVQDKRLNETKQGTNAKNERLRIILDCIVLLDKLSESLPRAEEFSSSWLSSTSDSERAISSSSGTLFVLEQDLWNEILKEWMVAWNEQQLHGHHGLQSKLPNPSQMATRVDRYRSRCLVQPNPTSYNILLNAMINGNSKNSNQRIKAIKLADYYLKRLLDAQQESVSIYENYIDTISVTTVIKGWIGLGQPQKALVWLDVMEDNANAGIPPNAVAYSTLIHGWARRGDPFEAEVILDRAIRFACNALSNQMHAMDNEMKVDKTSSTPLIDRVVFHTVLDAWAAKASRGTTNSSLKVNEGTIAEPSLRAKALVQKMNDLADEHPLWFGDNLRPNDETWHKLIAVVASTPSARSKANIKEVGPEAAEQLLLEMEETKDQKGVSKTPVLLLNRILHAFCSCGKRMEEAEAFYHRRCSLLEGETHQGTFVDFPNEVTFNIILSGWANAARVREKAKKKKPSNNSDIALRAEAWLMTMQEQNYSPSTRSYGSVLQAWSLSTKFYSDTANRAEDLLRNCVWTMLKEKEKDNTDPELATGVVICTNIVLRAWANQASSSGGNSVIKCLRLLSDFLTLLDNTANAGIELKPTEETFRAVLHTIATPSKSMNPVQKHDHAKVVLACMKDRFRLHPSKGDLAKFERLKKRKDAFLGR